MFCGYMVGSRFFRITLESVPSALKPNSGSITIGICWNINWWCLSLYSVLISLNIWTELYLFFKALIWARPLLKSLLPRQTNYNEGTNRATPSQGSFQRRGIWFNLNALSNWALIGLRLFTTTSLIVLTCFADHWTFFVI